MKKLLAVMVSVMALMSTVSANADTTEKNIDVLTNYVNIELDGENKNIRSFLADETTYIALRDVSELLGCMVDWVDETKTVAISTDKPADTVTDDKIEKGATVSETIAVMENYVKVEIDGEAKDVRNFLADGTTYIALRDVSELLGCVVGWDQATTKAIIVSDTKLTGETVMTINGKAVTDAEFALWYMVGGSGENLDESIESAKEVKKFYGILDEKLVEFNVGDRDKVRDEVLAELAFAEEEYGDDTYGPIPKEVFVDYLVNSYLYDELAEFMRASLPEYKPVIAEAKKYYDENKPEFKGKYVQVKHILIPDVDVETGMPLSEAEQKQVLATANSIAKKATPSNFDELIIEYDNDPGQSDEGYLVFEGSDFVPEFEAAALALKKNEISKPVKTEYGYHIILATEVYEYYPFEVFCEDYNYEKYNEIDNMYIDKWINEAEILYNEQLIRKVSALVEYSDVF